MQKCSFHPRLQKNHDLIIIKSKLSFIGTCFVTKNIYDQRIQTDFGHCVNYNKCVVNSIIITFWHSKIIVDLGLRRTNGAALECQWKAVLMYWDTWRGDGPENWKPTGDRARGSGNTSSGKYPTPTRLIFWQKDVFLRNGKRIMHKIPHSADKERVWRLMSGPTTYTDVSCHTSLVVFRC